MNKENKELLLRDLCARLSYGVKVHTEPYDVVTLEPYHLDQFEGLHPIPYLRPLSSMTEEEFEKLKEYSDLKYEQLDLASYQNGTYKCLDFYLSEVPSYVVILVFDWLNIHHFDYRGLIPMGLALEAPEGMYKTK